MVTSAKKHLTKKQIKYFGTKRQRAALHVRRPSVSHRTTTHHKKTTKKKAAAGSTNWLATIGAGLGGLAVGGVAGTLFGNTAYTKVDELLNKVGINLPGGYNPVSVSNPAPGSALATAGQVSGSAATTVQALTGGPVFIPGAGLQTSVSAPAPMTPQDLVDQYALTLAANNSPAGDTSSEVYQDAWNYWNY